MSHIVQCVCQQSLKAACSLDDNDDDDNVMLMNIQSSHSHKCLNSNVFSHRLKMGSDDVRRQTVTHTSGSDAEGIVDDNDMTGQWNVEH